ncbi:radical SAM family heme chaperone HemW [Riemerella anatipestifer]|nr:radical SAM family heme chaperone HemW [Riemerella anatipestifer]AZZ58009.1 coproporphyrinogen III oxidase family protein [Riemerella anatipestifer]MDD1538355.1 radical SAM family heme chaperone HemW [Riemerella anatipestifer]MRM86502.1 radical SAM family heme chaperone HemW [Riemerella anatipestifer]MRM94092.1 radical SAM family heme chaperone HemW [Riemerella anatipestifer]MRQ21912.1 radical SAM family heme chaperone HemW [Riemerella anatipestifer]
MIYLHIPFCKQKCSYCNFHFSTSLKLKDDMLLALKKELSLRQHELENKNLPSLYFGGGTPSILSVDEIQRLIDEVLRYFTFNSDIEITLEANPDDLNQSFLKALSNTPINRLSIGTQSFFEEDLKLMNRAHSASEAESSIKRAQDTGFENISIDLIYGSPTSNHSLWKESLQKSIKLQVPHISSYALTVEPKTALQKWIEQEKINAPKEEEQLIAFQYLAETLKANGFEHYEISNFSKPNYHSRHNTAYWKGLPYLGIGPSAHSYDGQKQRSWNIANNSLYIKSLVENSLPKETEILSEKEQFNELIMIGLRTKWGVEYNIINQFSEEILKPFQKSLEIKLGSGVLKLEDNQLFIPKEHWFMADGIISDLFVV